MVTIGPHRSPVFWGFYPLENGSHDRLIAYWMKLRVGFIVTNLSYPPKGITHFYNGRGTAEQWIKEGKYLMNHQIRGN